MISLKRTYAMVVTKTCFVKPKDRISELEISCNEIPQGNTYRIHLFNNNTRLGGFCFGYNNQVTFRGVTKRVNAKFPSNLRKRSVNIKQMHTVLKAIKLEFFDLYFEIILLLYICKNNESEMR